MSNLDHDHDRGDACCGPSEHRQAAVRAATDAGWLHIPTMDCVAEESEIRRALDFQAKLILPCGGVGVREIGTAHTIARRRFFRALFDALQITCAAGATALNQALGDGM